jgi:hypothetical protein
LGRWDFLYDLEARPIGDWLLDRLAEELANDIRAFPPRIEAWEDEQARIRYAPLLETGAQPSEVAVRTAIWLAQSDLRREFEAVDQFMRGGGIDNRLGSSTDRELCRFLWRYLEDKCLAFAEATRSRFKRGDLADALGRVEKLLSGVSAPRPPETRH